MSSKPLGFGNRHIEPNPAAVKDKLSLAASDEADPVSDDLPIAAEVERIVETQEGTDPTAAAEDRQQAQKQGDRSAFEHARASSNLQPVRGAIQDIAHALRRNA